MKRLFLLLIGVFFGINANAQGCISGDCNNGYGIHTMGGNRFEGNFKNGMIDGNGSLILSNGSKYVGQFKAGKYYGRGSYTGANGFQYIGQWVDDRFDGEGVYTNAEGDKHSGMWRGGMMQGAGSQIYKGDGSLSGTFVEGTLENNKGTRIYANGAKFVGVFLKGSNGSYKNGKEGAGTRYLPNGKLYSGEWNKGVIISSAKN